ncbi:MAG: PH domain-containing protein [Victivallales bacterium]|nr:PH domain-containing protein [Victivallales bacterium]
MIRYFTLRYHFDTKGISMRWGFLIRREVNLTYSRIQDIHLTSSVIQRWFNLADIMIQTASGNAAAEMRIEGLHEYEYIRSFIYSQMRGYRDLNGGQTAATDEAHTSQTAILEDIRRELAGARAALEQLVPAVGEDPHHV